MTVQHTLLRLLMEGPTHGYELRRKLSMYRHFYPLSNVNVYPVLRDLDQQGLVTSHTEMSESRMRKVYAITEKGVAAFEEWIEAAPDASVAAETDVVALKLLLARSRSGGMGLTWLSRSLSDLDAEVAGWRAYIEARGADIPRLVRLTAEYRLRCRENRRDYIAEAMQVAMAAAHEDGEPGPPARHDRAAGRSSVACPTGARMAGIYRDRYPPRST